MNAETRAIVTKCMPFYQHHSGGTLLAYPSMRCTHSSERTLVWGFIVGGGVGSIYFAGMLFVQRQILRSECCLKSNCSTSFLLFSSPCFCCLFTFWQSLSLFCYFQPSHFISAYTFLWKWCSGFRGCLLVVIQPLSSPLPAPALICHAVSSPPLILLSTVWAF